MHTLGDCLDAHPRSGIATLHYLGRNTINQPFFWFRWPNTWRQCRIVKCLPCVVWTGNVGVPVTDCSSVHALNLKLQLYINESGLSNLESLYGTHTVVKPSLRTYWKRTLPTQVVCFSQNIGYVTLKIDIYYFTPWQYDFNHQRTPASWLCLTWATPISVNKIQNK